MEKRVSARAIIIEDGKLLTMFRRKKKEDGSYQEYYAIPGGGLEENETLKENVIREIKEELNIDIEILGYLGHKEDYTSITYFFHCKRIHGEPKLGGPELKRSNVDNYYEIRYVNLDEIDNINIFYRDIIKKSQNFEYVPY
ncbi:MAG TPA: NUDIX domain-containing protein [Tenericutes bacterium]|jgi:ADP-ribose pyrophosphatase YjhB (NUDIX family)|nr:NUDIX domain-containing protein [Mycoplasmatota bacterium]